MPRILNFGEGDIAITLAAETLDGPANTLVLEPDRGTGNYGDKGQIPTRLEGQIAGETTDEWDENSIILVFPHSRGVRVLLESLQQLHDELRQNETRLRRRKA